MLNLLLGAGEELGSELAILSVWHHSENSSSVFQINLSWVGKQSLILIKDCLTGKYLSSKCHPYWFLASTSLAILFLTSAFLSCAFLTCEEDLRMSPTAGGQEFALSEPVSHTAPWSLDCTTQKCWINTAHNIKFFNELSDCHTAEHFYDSHSHFHWHWPCHWIWH